MSCAPTIIFVPGWGEGPWAFDLLLPYLPAKGRRLFVEHGFFGEEPGVIESGARHPAQPTIAITHSMGLPWLLRSPLLSEVDGIFAIAGFCRFGRRRLLDSMRRRFKREPEGTLRDFWKNSDLPEGPQGLAERLIPERLLLALEWLDTWDERSSLARFAEARRDHDSIYSVAANDDRIVDPGFTREMQMTAVMNHTTLARGGHALMATQPANCAELFAGLSAGLATAMRGEAV